MNVKIWAALALIAAPGIAAAQTVTECKDAFDADSIVEPWEANSATYAKGEVRIAKLDMIEPAAVPFALLVLSPPRDEVGGRSCHIIHDDAGNGFAELDFEHRTSAYDAENGLTLDFPVSSYQNADQEAEPVRLHVSINQQTGKVSAWKSH